VSAAFAFWLNVVRIATGFVPTASHAAIVDSIGVYDVLNERFAEAGHDAQEAGKTIEERTMTTARSKKPKPKKPKPELERVPFSTLYYWECPRCGSGVWVGWMPKVGGKVTCPEYECDTTVICDEITEEERPRESKS